ncbi:phage tail sheath family protein [Streptomyces sp. NPDC053048]|uniref:phage tail sheath family protein n=1 Tax=Streptomyces sp. NPDC053048 TaxID=3365694 RepID=UPI0037D40225
MSSDGHLAEAVCGFFSNGGRSCYVVPLDPSLPPLEALEGDAQAGTGLAGLEELSEVSMVAVPELWAMADKADAATLMNAVVRHCATKGDRVAILDAPPDIAPDRLLDHLPALSGDTSFATVYYPWVTVPGLAGTERTVPPCGHIAGVWARTDTERGVFKPPANQLLRGVSGLAYTIEDHQNGALNERGINCSRVVPGQDIRVWGARTQADADQSDWRYVNVRRMACYLEDSIKQSTGWAAFEPNDERLWSTLRGAITEFLTDQWRKGAMPGARPEQAFTVQCDSTNNTPPTIQQNVVRCDIGIAPTRPGEFVYFTVTQAVGAPRP